MSSGLPLGIAADESYPHTTLADTALTFVSDGVVEAANSRGELFGFDRTAATSLKTAGAIAEAAQAWGQNDDITVLTVRRAQLRVSQV